MLPLIIMCAGSNRSILVGTHPGVNCLICRQRAEDKHQVRVLSDRFCHQPDRIITVKYQAASRWCNLTYTRAPRLLMEEENPQQDKADSTIVSNGCGPATQSTIRCSRWWERPTISCLQTSTARSPAWMTHHRSRSLARNSSQRLAPTSCQVATAVFTNLVQLASLNIEMVVAGEVLAQTQDRSVMAVCCHLTSSSLYCQTPWIFPSTHIITRLSRWIMISNNQALEVAPNSPTSEALADSKPEHPPTNQCKCNTRISSSEVQDDPKLNAKAHRMLNLPRT